MRLRSLVRSRRALLGLAALLVLGGVTFADWRDLVDWPDLMRYEGQRFDGFRIRGEAPWCFVHARALTYQREALSDRLPVDCNYLSEMHCQLQNHYYLDRGLRGIPEERAVCVPNPLD
jgi:hypothetical protein